MNTKEKLIDVGFTEEQAETLVAVFARKPHTHKISDVEGLEEELEMDPEDVIDSDDDDEDEEEY